MQRRKCKKKHRRRCKKPKKQSYEHKEYKKEEVGTDLTTQKLNPLIVFAAPPPLPQLPQQLPTVPLPPLLIPTIPHPQ